MSAALVMPWPEGLCPSQAMDGTTKRLKIADVVTNMFRSVLALSPGGWPFLGHGKSS
jgi:hypothetical protein